MTCHEGRALLSPYHDGQLAPPLSAAVTNHLQSCPECRAELAELALVCDLVAGLPPRRLPHDLAQAVVARAQAPRCSRLQAARESLLPARFLLRRELGRVLVAIVLFALAGTSPGLGGKVAAWPVRAAGMVTGRLSSGVAELQLLLHATRAAAAPDVATRQG